MAVARRSTRGGRTAASQTANETWMSLVLNTVNTDEGSQTVAVDVFDVLVVVSLGGGKGMAVGHTGGLLVIALVDVLLEASGVFVVRSGVLIMG